MLKYICFILIKGNKTTPISFRSFSGVQLTNNPIEIYNYMCGIEPSLYKAIFVVVFGYENSAIIAVDIKIYLNTFEGQKTIKIYHILIVAEQFIFSIICINSLDFFLRKL